MAASDDVARQIDSSRTQLGEGPCLDAIEDETVYHDSNLLDGSPWPLLAERVLAETPVRGMAGFRLRAAEEKTAPSTCSPTPPAGSPPTLSTRASCWRRSSTVALRAYHDRRTADTLRDGLQSNREIGKAVGLMMAFHKISDDDAFEHAAQGAPGHEHQAGGGRPPGRGAPQRS